MVALMHFALTHHSYVVMVLWVPTISWWEKLNSPTTCSSWWVQATFTTLLLKDICKNI